ncbi:MAG: DUF4838 domain-containing protein, partial [Lentisphaeria bacterium]|nr:DUF4838 domain-containing protein [Lentisphaeria bacterium]
LMGDDYDKLPGFYGYEFNYRTSRRGTLFAVYTLLEKAYGVRWLWPGPSGEIIPRRDTIVLPNMELRDQPNFSWRHIWWYKLPSPTRSEVTLWYMRNKLGIGFGGHSSFAHSWFGHMEGNKHFADHPEWYSLIRGERRPFVTGKDGKTIGMSRQVCTSNPEVVAQFVRSLRRRYDPKDDVLASISPNDGSGFCECAQCKALDHPELYGPKEGYDGLVLSDRIFTFVNTVAREIRKTHPKLRLGIYSYTYLRPSPRSIAKLEPNVLVGMTQIQALYGDPAYQARDHKRADEWVARGGTLMAREYLGDYHWLLLIHPQTRILAQNLRRLKAKGYAGYDSESGLDFASNHLNYYVMARMLWDVNLDLDTVIMDFCTKAYGPAAAEMRAFYTLLEDNFASRDIKHMEWFAGHFPQWNRPETMALARRHLKAATAAADSDAIRTRIQYATIGLDLTEKTAEFLRLCQRLTDSGLPVHMRDYTKQSLPKTPSRDRVVAWIKEAKARGDALFAYLEPYAESSAAHPWPLLYMDATERWRTTVDEYHKLYVGQPDEIVDLLPLVWCFRTDPKDDGEQQGWQHPDFDDTAWSKIKTDAFWEKQGNEGYDGYAWYRLGGVKIPSREGATHHLRFGAVDESCRLFVNGKLAGTFDYDEKKDPDSWKKSLEFDVTSFVRPGNENAIAVRVHDNAYAGGIWKRVFLITRGGKEPESPKEVMHADFEDDLWRQRVQFGGKNHEVQLAPDGGHESERSLQIRVNGPFPDECSIHWTKVSVKPGATYALTVFYRIVQAEENAGENRKWLRRPALPDARIIAIDAKGKKCGTSKDTIWARAAFQAKTEGWQTLRKVFSVPQTAAMIHLKISFHAKGEYRLDDVIIQTW